MPSPALRVDILVSSFSPRNVVKRARAQEYTTQTTTKKAAANFSLRKDKGYSHKKFFTAIGLIADTWICAQEVNNSTVILKTNFRDISIRQKFIR